MRLIITEQQLYELLTKEKPQINTHGYYSNVYNVGKDKVSKVIKQSKGHVKSFIVKLYDIMKRYPDVFGDIKITSSGSIVQTKFDTVGFKKIFFKMQDYLNDNGIFGGSLDYILDPIVEGTWTKEQILDIYRQITDPDIKTEFAKLIKFLFRVKEVYQQMGRFHEYKSPDLHDDNLAIDSNGNYKVIDFIYPNDTSNNDEVEQINKKIAKKLEKHKSKIGQQM